MSRFLDTEIEFLKGVGPQKAELLKSELGIYTFGHLLHYYPFRHVDRSVFQKVKEIKGDENFVQLKGTITRFDSAGMGSTRRLTAEFSDDTGSIELVWFKGAKWIQQSIKLNTPYIVYGKPNWFKNHYNIAHPEMDVAGDDFIDSGKFQPVYNSGEKLAAKGLNSRGIEKLLRTLTEKSVGQVPDFLPKDILERAHLIDKETALLSIHFPKSSSELAAATLRLKFDELFYVQLRLLRQKITREKLLKGFSFDKIGSYFNDFYSKHLPFELTNAQKRVVKEIRKDMGSGKQMNRLLQGDVGSGKTMVAELIMLIAADNGFQSCLMAPTEILANQHFESISKDLEKAGMKIALLTGSTKQSERNVLFEELKSGQINILVGTHALLEDLVVFKNLGLVVIDEQHRFGVAQRAKMWKKNSTPPHVLVMTATPIPRTLAMTIYGDLDTSILDEMPPGRKLIKTVHKTDSQRMSVFGFMKEQISLGRQVYVVYPLIEESEKMDYKDLTDGYESICRSFPSPQFKVSIVHGRMKGKDKDYEMQRFAKGETNLLVATTVIEVGVNVPNASVMVIESAERFGLSQLHQLRGRVGRGAEQSYCILMTGDKLGADAKTRIETMVSTNDGFIIAETDLKLRGPGDITGTQQSGAMEFSISDLTTDGDILKLARLAAEYILNKDLDLNLPEHANLRQHLIDMQKEKPNWGRIA